MKKIIRKFWGVAFTVALLSTLLIGAIPQASAASYAFAGDISQPTAANRVLAPVAGWGAIDVAQVGNTIFVTGKAGAGGASSIYRSTDGGVTWTPLAGVGLNANMYLGFIAVPPDATNIIAVVNTAVNPNVVYLSNNGGATFAAAGVTPGYIKGISISPALNGTNRMVIVGNTEGPDPHIAYAGFIQQWQIGSVAPAWAALGGVGLPAVQDFVGVAHSTNFNADKSMLVVSHNSTAQTALATNCRGLTQLHVYSFSTGAWDALVDVTFPRTLYQGALTVDASAAPIYTDNVSHCDPVKFALDPNFYMGDSAAQIGFFVVNLTSNATGAAAQVGGLYRLQSTTTTAIKASMAFNGVAWDGTNVMASQNGTFATAASGTPVWRSANALAPTPTVLLNSVNKPPATGNSTRVWFAGGVSYAASSGANGGIAKSADYGKTWNGFALLNTTFATISDFWVSSDDSRLYAITDDGVDINLWRRSGTTWERVFILPAANTQTYLVRADADNPDTVYLGRQGNVNMYKSLNAGESWDPRACSAAIQDFAVQDASVIYVALQGATNAAMSLQGAFTWESNKSTMLNTTGGGNCHSITLLSDGNALIGGTAGGVSYSTNNGTSWTATAANLIVGGNVVATANGLGTGNIIWAGSAAGGAGAVASWTIGTSTAVTGWTAATWAGAFVVASADGICYNSNGVLYVWDGTPRLLRALTPTRTINPTTTDVLNVGALAFLAAQTVNALQITNSGAVNTIVARDNAGTDTIQGYSDYLATSENVPSPTYPLENAIIPINSISGIINAFTFQWNTPPALADFGANYLFDLQVYLDSAGTILVGSNVGQSAARGGGLAAAASALGLGGGVAYASQPGTTYYWRVRTNVGNPVLSNWSAMQTFVIQQLTAIVPIIATPLNGGEVDTQSPAFSWTPIALCTGYRFELALDSEFTDVVYTVDPATAGASLPSTMSLTRGLQYFWRVKALTPMEGEWSAVANFIVAELPPPSPTPTTTIVPTPTITAIITQPAATTTQIVIPPADVKEVNPSYIWAIIIVGAVLVIAVIILIVRTRRTV